MFHKLHSYDTPIQRRVAALLSLVTVAILLLFASGSALAQNNGDTLRWNGSSGTTSWITNNTQWYNLNSSSNVSIHNGLRQNNNYIFRFDGAVTNGTVAPTTMTISNANLFSTEIVFANGFNSTNTTSISNGSATPSTVTLGSVNGSGATTATPWALTNNATSGNLTFTAGGTGTLTFRLFDSGTVSVATGGTTTLALPITDYDTNRTGGITKTGGGTLVYSGSLANTYSGLTAVNSGTLILNKTAGVNAIAGDVKIGDGTANSATVQWNASNQIANGSAIELAGGTLNLNGNSEINGTPSGTSAGVGALTLTATSTIDFGAGSNSIIHFAGLGTQTNGTVLQIINWDGNPDTGGTGDRLLFTGDASSFTGMYGQNEVSFDGLLGYNIYQFGGFYEVTAVPEPGTWLAGALAVGALFYMRRRRLTSRLARA